MLYFFELLNNVNTFKNINNNAKKPNSLTYIVPFKFNKSILDRKSMKRSLRPF